MLLQISKYKSYCIDSTDHKYLEDNLDSISNRSRRDNQAQLMGLPGLMNKSAVGSRCFKCGQWQLIDFAGTKLDDRSSWFVWCSWLNELMALGVTDPFFRSFAVHSNCMCPPVTAPPLRPPDTEICKGNAHDRFLFFSARCTKSKKLSSVQIKFLDLYPEKWISRAFRELLTPSNFYQIYQPEV